MRFERDDPGFDRIVTLDIETTHYDPQQGEVVSVGVGEHCVGEPASEASYHLFHRDDDGEGALISRAVDHVNGVDADGLVTYNGRGLDIDFFVDRMYLLQESKPQLVLNTDETHIDLFTDRKTLADRRGDKWPGLEECLDAYDLPVPKTEWNGREVTNTIFGDELGPTYLNALADADLERLSPLMDLMDHYLITDLEANLALYHADTGRMFDAVHLGDHQSFDV